MKRSKQIQSLINKKSGQEVAKQNFGKTDARYWQAVIFKPIYTRDGKTHCVEDWATRIQWRGQSLRSVPSLGTQRAMVRRCNGV